ncbi:transposase [Aliiroseovarius crassostreae]|uniref:transposase n=1 Tax=Aliiroseovarius crassostreae TaxID=154981 RepID=UPI001587910E
MSKKQRPRAGYRQDKRRVEFKAASDRRHRADITHANQCFEPYIARGTTVIAGRGYDANHLRDWLSDAKATACIPPCKNRKMQFEYDADLSKTRNIVERMFNRLKDWRQLSLRTFRCQQTFLAAAHIAATVIWLL